MKQSRKDFIIEAHKNACREWKQKIEKEFPKLFKNKQKEIRKWYIYGNSFLHCYQGEYSYGFNWLNEWNEKLKACNDLRNSRPATKKEVEDALIKEAKKRGFKKGANINNITYLLGTQNTFGITDITYYHNTNEIIDNQRAIIFQDGKWATLIEETITKEEAEKLIGKKII